MTKGKKGRSEGKRGHFKPSSKKHIVMFQQSFLMGPCIECVDQ